MPVRLRSIILSISGGILVAIKGPQVLMAAKQKYIQHQLQSKTSINVYQPPHSVILGSGWGAISVLKRLIPGAFRVTLISPANYFLFTPLLPSAAVGTVEPRSIIEPVRNILRRLEGNYICAKAIDVDLAEGYVTCRSLQGDLFTIDYNYLVIAIGSQVNTFNTPGVDEHALKLKCIADSRQVRGRLMENFERAHLLPPSRHSERAQLLKTVIVGGGPTGVELAAEIYDLLKEDMVKLYPAELVEQAKVILVQSADHILNSFDMDISRYSEKVFLHDGIKVLTNARVLEVQADHIVYEEKSGMRSIHTIPSGLTVWSTGIARVPLVQLIIERISEQNHASSLLVDAWLRLKGVERNNVFALGDCATIQIGGLLDYWDTSNREDIITITEMENKLRKLELTRPELKIHLLLLKQLLTKFSPSEETRGWNINLVHHLMREVDTKLRSLPATAQVAAQQGRYLGDLLNKMAWSRFQTRNQEIGFIPLHFPPFFYKHLASAAYLGMRRAVLDFGQTWYGDRFWAFWLWRSIYLNEQVSQRTRLMVAFDWFKMFCFGRDISNIK